MALRVKDPDSVIDYVWDWSAWLGADTILTSTWIVPTGLTKTSQSNTTTTATVWLSGGTLGASYQVTNRIVTNQGRTEDRTMEIVIRER